VVELTQSEANALAEGNTKSRAWKSAMEKVRMKARVGGLKSEVQHLIE
jgi:hypothetical protein